MALKNPKNKGNSFEREVAKQLSTWAGVKFMRTPSSGAIHNFNDKRVVSDIVAPLSLGEFPFSIECKNVECSWEFSTFLEGSSQTLKQHWNQCIIDADREKLIPMLVFTKNFRPIYVMLWSATFNQLPLPNIPHMEIWYIDSSVIIMKFSDLLKNLSCETLMNLDLLHKVS